MPPSTNLDNEMSLRINNPRLLGLLMAKSSFKEWKTIAALFFGDSSSLLSKLQLYAINCSIEVVNSACLPAFSTFMVAALVVALNLQRKCLVNFSPTLYLTPALILSMSASFSSALDNLILSYSMLSILSWVKIFLATSAFSLSLMTSLLRVLLFMSYNLRYFKSTA